MLPYPFVFTDDLLADLVARCQRGRTQDTAQVGDIQVARIGRYVICFRLDPMGGDYTLHTDVWQATEAFTALLEGLRSGGSPPF